VKKKAAGAAGAAFDLVEKLAIDITQQIAKQSIFFMFLGFDVG
jgi:hypothetical protein